MDRPWPPANCEAKMIEKLPEEYQELFKNLPSYNIMEACSVFNPGIDHYTIKYNLYKQAGDPNVKEINMKQVCGDMMPYQIFRNYFFYKPKVIQTNEQSVNDGNEQNKWDKKQDEHEAFLVWLCLNFPTIDHCMNAQQYLIKCESVHMVATPATEYKEDKPVIKADGANAKIKMFDLLNKSPEMQKQKELSQTRQYSQITEGIKKELEKQNV